MRLNRYLSYFFFSLIIVGCGEEEIIVPGSITGVTLSGSQVLSSVDVTLSSPTGEVVATAKSSNSGLFTFPTLEPGVYSLLSSLKDYEDKTSSVTVVTAANTQVSVDMVALKGDVIGVVQDQNGVAIAEATAVLKQGSATVSQGISNASGSFSFTGLRVGNYEINVSKENYEPFSGQVIVNSDENTQLSITLSALFADISGEVTSITTGLPLGDVSVGIYSGTQEIATTITSSLGEYSFSAIAFGTYEIRYTVTGYLPKQEALTISSNNPITVDIQMEPAVANFKVSVLDNFNAPLKNSSLKLMSNGTVAYQFNMSSSQHEHTFNNISVGSYDLVVTRSGFKEKTVAVSVVQNTANATNVNLSPESLPSGGLLNSIAVTYSGNSATFDLDLFVVDENSVPYANLTAAAFNIPDGNFSTSSGSQLFDFTTISATSQTGTPGPYSANLLMDQSGSITSTDPSDSRIQASKIFLGALGSGDFATVSAFSGSISNEVEVYGGFVSDGKVYYSQVDALANSEVGGTPLYNAIYKMIDYTSSNATTQNKAVVVFTDGENTSSGRSQTEVEARANQMGVKLFTVGLSSGTNRTVLGQMAERTGGAFMNALDARELISLFGTLGNLLGGRISYYRVRFTVSTTAIVFPGSFTTTVNVTTSPGNVVSMPIYVEISASNTSRVMSGELPNWTNLKIIPNKD